MKKVFTFLTLAICLSSLGAAGVKEAAAAADTAPFMNQQQDRASAIAADYEKQPAEMVAALDSMLAETVDRFQVFTYEDEETGLSVEYNLYVPAGYTEISEYPMVVFIGDARTVGNDPSLPLRQGFGGIVWASYEEQEKHPSFVLVPQYPEVILDDHGAFTMTEYVDLTARLIEHVEALFSIDERRVYGTGQSMGCMTVMYLAANYPELFAAELFVDGQWNIDELSGLSGEIFIFVVAGGDEKALGGQNEVKALLDGMGISYGAIEDVDAKASAEELDTIFSGLLSSGYTQNFITWKTGSVLPENPGERASEHVFSFNYGYKSAAIRDWLFSQASVIYLTNSSQVFSSINKSAIFPAI